jgi:adenylate kinase
VTGLSASRADVAVQQDVQARWQSLTFSTSSAGVDPRRRTCTHGVIMLGAPGSGKSTHGARLAERLGAAHLELGSLLRALASEDSRLGRAVRDAVADGRLVPDNVVDRIVDERLAALPNRQGFVLDGYPRNAAQAAALRRLLTRLGRPRPTVVHLQVPRDELRRRLSRRREREGRSDDTEETIARRLELEGAQTARVLDALGGWADVVDVDGTRPLEAVTEEILDRLGCSG